ncbi:MAG: GNAT family N-acetyltransferase [Hyphomicrobiaceae bacterium]
MSGPLEILSALRPAVAADARALAGLHGRAFHRGWSSAAFTDLLGLSTTRSLVLAASGEDGAITGLVLAALVLDEAEILTLAVDPDHRRAGLGRQLLAALAERLQGEGARRIFLDVAAGNAPALALYRACGFVSIGRRRGYYGGEADGADGDAVLMECGLAIQEGSPA